MTPLDRAARALHEASRQTRFVRDCADPSAPPAERPMPFVSWDDLRSADRDTYTERAHAVITAIREPSEAMKISGEMSADRDGWQGAGDCWAYMIDALLEEAVARR